VPILTALILVFVPKRLDKVFRYVSIGVSILLLAPIVKILSGFQGQYDGMLKFTENYPWIDSWGISYLISVDGISLFLVILTVVMTVLALLSSWKAIENRVKEYSIAMLLMEGFMVGAFLALDLVLFYLFFEGMLIPMYLLIGIWGGPRRIYAAVKFFIYTMVGSVFMLIGIIFIYWLHYQQSGFLSMNVLHMYQTIIPPVNQVWLFLAFGLAFAIKVPLFPFHTWLPDAHVEAPTAGSVLLAAILLKMGGYGFLRFAIPIFPDASFLFIPLVAVLSIIGIIYGSLVAMAQPDLKKLVAYSSVAHMGFVMLGIFSFTVTGISGGVYQMLNHGVSTGALFLLVGVIYERTHTRMIADYGGAATKVPAFAVITLIVVLSSIGLPGTNGFVGEFLILFGMFKSKVVEFSKVYTILGATGIVLGAVYMLWMYQKIFFGPVKGDKVPGLKDLCAREFAYLLPIIVLIFYMGIYPKPILSIIEPSAKKIMAILESKGFNMEREGEESGATRIPERINKTQAIADTSGSRTAALRGRLHAAVPLEGATRAPIKE
jgi:NADH-quinone oxidoreductase subunit M